MEDWKESRIILERFNKNKINLKL